MRSLKSEVISFTFKLSLLIGLWLPYFYVISLIIVPFEFKNRKVIVIYTCAVIVLFLISLNTELTILTKLTSTFLFAIYLYFYDTLKERYEDYINRSIKK